MVNEKILIVDDEEHIRELLKYNLEKSGYDCIIAENGLEALKIVKDQRPRLVLLDLTLPKMDGYEVCKEIRKDDEISWTPIIILSAKDEESDKVMGLNIGADDYITKPFSVREILTRIKVLLRRSCLKPLLRTYTFGNITIDFDNHEVSKSDKKINLTFTEFKLVEIFIKNKGTVMTKDFLLDKIWGYNYVGKSKTTVAIHVFHIRKKIEDNYKEPYFIETIRGIGYKFNGPGCSCAPIDSSLSASFGLNIISPYIN